MGGNMDIRDMSAGTELYLPVEVVGGLFSVGDTHATQGDGEVCGTAIESPCSLAARFDLVKGANLKFPRFTTPGPVTRHLDDKGYEATTGIGPDLMEASKAAVMGMVELLSKRHQDERGRRLHALLGRRRPADQRDRRYAELGRVLLFPALRFRVTHEVFIRHEVMAETVSALIIRRTRLYRTSRCSRSKISPSPFRPIPARYRW